MRRVLGVLGLLLVVTAAVAWWLRPAADGGALQLYGNVEVRQVNLAFTVEGRLDRLLFDEGASVRKGDLLAALDTGYLEDAVRIAQGRVDAARARLAMLRTGSRPEEIRQAEAAVAAAEATARDARRTLDREQQLLRERQTSQARVDAARAASEQADAALDSARQRLKLAQDGPRSEERDAAEAALATEQAILDLMQRRLRDAALHAPADGVIQTRVHEPGEVLAPGATVYALALREPLWVRAFVAEPDLGRVQTGMAVEVSSDSAPGQRFRGVVGFMSPTAEFTPKTVETPELRTDLVYRLRVVMSEGAEVLRQGMPVTVHVPAAAP